jgi:hypothetical protein
MQHAPYRKGRSLKRGLHRSRQIAAPLAADRIDRGCGSERNLKLLGPSSGTETPASGSLCFAVDLTPWDIDSRPGLSQRFGRPILDMRGTAAAVASAARRSEAAVRSRVHGVQAMYVGAGDQILGPSSWLVVLCMLVGLTPR